MSETNKYSKNQALLEKFLGGDESAAEELISLNMGLVRSIAFRFRDRGTDQEDLIQIGTIGMLRAARSFDISRGTSFSTYAVPLIIGEIRRHLRDDGIIKVSRTHKRLGMELMRARQNIITNEGREPQIDELAALCGVSAEDAAFALDAAAPVHSLCENVYSGDGESGMTLESTLSDGGSDIERIFDRIALGEALDKMPLIWRKILLMRYYRDLTQQQTADLLGLSQVKVSREEKKILQFLRNELEK